MQNLKPPSKFSFKPKKVVSVDQTVLPLPQHKQAGCRGRRNPAWHPALCDGRGAWEDFWNTSLWNCGSWWRGRGERSARMRHCLQNKFDLYFLVRRNIIHERTKLQVRKQYDCETIEEYYRSLHALVDHCEYIDIEDQVQDRFVVGLTDSRLKDKLQLIHELTLAKALEIARQHE